MHFEGSAGGGGPAIAISQPQIFTENPNKVKRGIQVMRNGDIASKASEAGVDAAGGNPPAA